MRGPSYSGAIEMAIWQFRLVLVPVKAVQSICNGVLPPAISAELAEEFRWWSGAKPRMDFESRIDTILPRRAAWSKHMQTCGKKNGDTVTIGYDSKNTVKWIECCIDVRTLSQPFLRSVCTLANELGAVFVTAKYRVLEPVESAVLSS